MSNFNISDKKTLATMLSKREKTTELQIDKRVFTDFYSFYKGMNSIGSNIRIDGSYISHATYITNNLKISRVNFSKFSCKQPNIKIRQRPISFYRFILCLIFDENTFHISYVK